MSEDGDLLRERLKEAMGAKDISASQLSLQAGLNRRAVKDIEEGRAASPKISTVFALAEALGVSPAYLLGLPAGPTRLEAKFLDLLRQYDEDGQEQLLKALQTLSGRQT